jgi:hypothetical protein
LNCGTYHCPAGPIPAGPLERKETAAAAKESAFLGGDVEPLWAIDWRVEPGKTYRYRLRILALNTYAGVAVDLKRPNPDAGRVLLEGKWSEWSDEIVAQPDRYLFFTGAKPETKTASVRLFEWSNGKWTNASEELGVGQPVKVDKGRKQMAYEAVVANLEFGRPYRERSVGRDNVVQYDEKTTHVLTLINGEGLAVERFAAADSNAARELQRELREEDNIEKTIATNALGYQRPAPRPAPGMGPAGRGRPGLGDPRDPIRGPAGGPRPGGS